ncbi:hypothetical protein SAMN05216341_101174 [Leuconostocaceae bacterium R-53105]|uniref:Uncharacterized protein n=1 Tax=Convivina intestini TaxID=1505726 RepID=A0A2U1DF09_9LACO|nr:hypothetical protein C7384_101182 [Convivina intestini]CAH1851133.1 hypothetical protein R077811_00231 [Convivina intestini]SDB82014.1 hypothetical protein SAMN05216341_101174 [Leuconostocaceae bacterium R-53105]
MANTLDGYIEKELNDSVFATLYESATKQLENTVTLGEFK